MTYNEDVPLINQNKSRNNILKMVELVGVLMAITASLYLSVEQQSANLTILFGVFVCSSIILTVTTLMLKNYNYLLMSAVYLMININGFWTSLGGVT